jgi:hypothetical protein
MAQSHADRPGRGHFTLLVPPPAPGSGLSGFPTFVHAVDHLSGGRAAVNCVASAGDAMARNFSLDAERPHAQRYARTEEYLEAMAQLWDAAGTGTEPARAIDHHGEFFDVAGPARRGPPACRALLPHRVHRHHHL